LEALGFDPSEPLPYTGSPAYTPHGMLGRLANYFMACSSDDGYPLQVWNVDGYQPGAARNCGGPPDYVDGASAASFRMGMIHSVVMACPEVACDSFVLDGEALEGINGFMLVQYPSARTMARMINDPAFEIAAKHDDAVFAKNMDVPARVLNDGLTTVPSPLAIFQKQVPTDCEDPAWRRARKAEDGVDADGRPCDVDKFKAGMAEFGPAAVEGHCGATGACKDWMLSKLQACAGALNMFSSDMFAQPQPPESPHGKMLLAIGLYQRALESGAVEACRGRTGSDDELTESCAVKSEL